MQLPQIEDSLLSVTDVIVNGKIKDKVNNGLREFDKIQHDIQNAVKDLIPLISHNVRRAGIWQHCFLVPFTMLSVARLHSVEW
jgi:hypothetical protein